MGLSPLARGNPGGQVLTRLAQGPIPARTGQPELPPSASATAGAYPRSHGATAPGRGSAPIHTGLSPLARGNPYAGRHEKAASGPIPARTGQPLPMLALWCPRGAYPRSHGATAAPRAKTFSTTGLSPLARGNQGHRGKCGQCGGPIPARTGQPGGSHCSCHFLGAYPRSHGATSVL